MRILKEGTPATAVTSCPHCKCEMEYTNQDMFPDYGNTVNQYTYPVSRLLCIKCPCCGEHITVNKL